ncbi:MAG TPA: hypothetical protein VI299_12875 [Polyangiales bacterium]
MRRTNVATVLAVLALAGCLEPWSSYQEVDCMEFQCVWTTEAGSIEKTGSWNTREFAFSLQGTPARISRKFDWAQIPECLAVEMTANVAKDAQLELQLDYGADGIVDARVPVEPGRWTHRSYSLRTPSNTRHLRASFEKLGPGEAALQHIELAHASNCTLELVTLPDAAPCLDDLSCASGHCVLGKCSPCGAGGCAEGSPCRDGSDCASGSCAAGLCRACAATGGCGVGEGCSGSSQCASNSCVLGGRPSLTQYPFLDGICGECDADADCGSGHCVLGQCATCVSDSDCPTTQRCRYQEAFEATLRTCVPRFNGILPRGALCEEDIECAGGLRCAGTPNRAKRCGGACGSDVDCGDNEVCTNRGSLASTSQAGIYELLPAFRDDASARINTCHPLVQADDSKTKCLAHAQCTRTDQYDRDHLGPYAKSVCCEGACTMTGVSLETGLCSANDWWP